MRFPWISLGLLCGALLSPAAFAQNNDGGDVLPALVEVLKDTDDAQFQLDVLKGISEALKGQRQVKMPAGWEAIETKLGGSANTEVRSLAQSLSLTFGSPKALAALRQTVADSSADIVVRRAALESLLSARDTGLPPILQKVLSDAGLRATALRGLGAYEDANTAPAILAVYGSLTGSEKRDALNTLCSRVVFAGPLLAAVDAGKVPVKDLSADLVRQLRNLKDAGLDTQIAKVWGVTRDTSADKKKDIERFKQVYRAGGSQPGDASRGRAVFARTCQQCHSLFDVGGKVGPDLTGSNRADLDYILENMVDPNAVIPNDYRTSTMDTKDGRVLTGIVKKADDTAVTIVTANETLIIPRKEVDVLAQSELSMMPEGLLDVLTEQEVRDLIYYLGRPGQVPLTASAETLGLFFNEHDLQNWEGNLDLWRVENGEIIGSAKEGLKDNEFLKSQMVMGDFRLILQVKLTPNSENSGIQFRSTPEANGSVKGYQADAGAGWWGKLYEEHGRALLWDKSGEAHVKVGEWNTYEIVAVGSRILTAINGKLCVDLDDPKGARQGIIAFQLHSGGPMEVRFKDLKLELNPKAELTTAK